MRSAAAWLAVALACAGCNQIFGLDPPVAGGGDGGDDDGGADDAGDGDVPVDAGCTPFDHDEDQDGVADACDTCPHIFDSEQLDVDGDRVGDACDPQPQVAGDRILLFLPFDVMPANVTFEPANTNQWSIDGDNLRQFVPTGTHLARFPLDRSAVAVTTQFSVDTFIAPTDGQTRSAGVWARIAPEPSPTPATPYGLLMEAVLEQMGTTSKHVIQLAALETSGGVTSARGEPPNFAFQVGQKYTVTIDATTPTLTGSASMPGIGGSVQLMSTQLAAGDVGLRTHATGVSFYYLFVVGRDD